MSISPGHLRSLFAWGCGLACIAIGFGLWVERYTADISHITNIATVASPGHVWNVVVTETFVESYTPAGSYVGDDVCLVPFGDSTHSVHILYVETDGFSGNHPTVTWTSDHNLRITMNDRQDPVEYVHDIFGVHVEVYHDAAADAAFEAAVRAGVKSGKLIELGNKSLRP